MPFGIPKTVFNAEIPRFYKKARLRKISYAPLLYRASGGGIERGAALGGSPRASVKLPRNGEKRSRAVSSPDKACAVPPIWSELQTARGEAFCSMN